MKLFNLIDLPQVVFNKCNFSRRHNSHWLGKLQALLQTDRNNAIGQLDRAMN